MEGGEGDDVAQALMVALGVVVLHELAYDGAQVTLLIQPKTSSTRLRTR